VKAVLAGRLLEPDSGNIIESGAVLLDSDRIAATGPRGSGQIPLSRCR